MLKFVHAARIGLTRGRLLRCRARARARARARTGHLGCGEVLVVRRRRVLVLLAELGDLATGKNQKIQKSIKITSINDFNAAQNLGFTVARQFVR